MEESSYHTSDDSDFANEESASVELANLFDFAEEDDKELQDLEDDVIAHNLLSCKMPPKKETHQEQQEPQKGRYC